MKYERLTVIHLNGHITISETKQLPNTREANLVLNRLAELENKIENGTLIELPCKVGDTVWYIKAEGEVIWVDEMIVKGFEFSRCNKVIFIVGTYREKAGKIYKTKAEAEAKLKELKGEA